MRENGRTLGVKLSIVCEGTRIEYLNWYQVLSRNLDQFDPCITKSRRDLFKYRKKFSSIFIFNVPKRIPKEYLKIRKYSYLILSPDNLVSYMYMINAVVFTSIDFMIRNGPKKSLNKQ